MPSRSLSLRSNDNLAGTIPAGLSALLGLQTLDLSECSLNGTIPGELGVLTNVSTLTLTRNDLSGSLPSSLGLLTALQYERGLVRCGDGAALCPRNDGRRSAV